jgi:fructoselysine 6-kinase
MRITAVGDCGVDRYVDIRADRPGGVSLNFAANARRCFEPEDRVGVLTVLGDDPEAAFVKAAIADQDVEAQIVYGRGHTPIQFIDRDENGERELFRYEAGALARHRMNADDRELLARSDVMIATVFTNVVDYFETVVQVPSAGLRALDYCNAGTSDDPLAFVRRYTEAFDIGFVSLSEMPAESIDQVEAVARASDRTIIATLGGRGSVALSRRARVECAALPVADVVDTTGAGDTFAAGFLSVFARGGSIADSLARGTREASRTIAHTGAFEAELSPWPEDAPAEWLKRPS